MHSVLKSLTKEFEIKRVRSNRMMIASDVPVDLLAVGIVQRSRTHFNRVNFVSK